MDFEPLDAVFSDTLGRGDIVRVDGEYHQLRGDGDADADGLVTIDSYNLTTGDDEDSVLFDADEQVTIFRVY